MFKSRAAWLALGVTLGFILALNVVGVWPQIPVHAVATHGQDSFAIATGPLDSDVEAVFFLDFLTGDLKGAVLSIQAKRFNAFYQYNVAKDFPTSKNPHYLMVTGMADVRRASDIPLGNTVIYVGELSSGQVNAYGVPYSSAAAAAGGTQKLSFIPFDRVKFRTVAVRGAP